MRTVIVFGVLGLALGLAAQMLPRALGDASVVSDGDARVASSLRQPALGPQPRIGITSSAVSGERAAVTSGDEKPGDHDNRSAEEWPAPARYNSSGEEDKARTIERLRAAGFTDRRARELILREVKLRDEAIKAEYAATGTIRALGGSTRSIVGQQFRKELGDAAYETYRESTGQPTRVRVGDVESGSAAANAGVLSGDEILSYGGRRVFDFGELTAMMLQTSIGETVPIAVVRDGQRLTLYVTGGPLGISKRAVR